MVGETSPISLTIGQRAAIAWTTTVTLAHFNQADENGVVTLSPKGEQFLWVVAALSAGGAFFAAHTFYVTRGTYAGGAVLLGITAFLFYMRLRPRQTPRTKSLTITSNTILVVLTLVVVLYLMGVATYYG